MDAVILFLVIWLVGRIFGALSKKKKGGAGTDKQQQAVEEQKRRREAYQAARRQEAARQHPPTQAQAARQLPQAEDDIPPYRRTAADDESPYRRTAADDDISPYHRDSAGEPPAAPLDRHHIDEAEEERCEEANKARQERRKQELRERFGTTGTRPQATPAAMRPNRPQTLVQAQRQLYASSPPPAAAAAPAKRQKAADDPQVQRRGVSLQGNALVQGIIMAEVLGPPRSKRKQIR